MLTNKEVQAKLKSRIEELEAQLRLEGITVEPTKMDEVMSLETDAVDSITEIINTCESKTGRKLSKRSLPEVEDASWKYDHRDSLKQNLRDLGSVVKQQYTFTGIESFQQWGREFLREGFENAKRKKRC